MRKSTKELNKHLRKNPETVIYTAGLLAFVGFLFVFACLYKIYDSAYTTHLSCNKDENICTITKQDILGQEKTEYEFPQRELESIELIERKNILLQDVYSLTLHNEETGNSYLLTNETTASKEQEEYLIEINNYLYNYFENELELENSRDKLKKIGFAAAAGGCMVAIFMLLDCIKKLQDFKKQKAKDFNKILNTGGF